MTRLLTGLLLGLSLALLGCAVSVANTPVPLPQAEPTPTAVPVAPTATPRLELVEPRGTPAPTPTTIPATPRPTPRPTLAGTSAPSVTPVSTPTPAPVPSPTPPPTVTPTPAPTVAPTPTLAPTPAPILEPRFTGVLGTNKGLLLKFRSYLPEAEDKNLIRRVVLTYPGRGREEFIVGLTRGNGVYHDGETYVADFKTQPPTLEWIKDNVALEIEEFPVRIACTGSMRPVIDCGDNVIFEPARFGDRLEVDDIITFRRSSTDIDVESDCPAFFNAPSLVGTDYIIHRIIQVLPGGETSYVTKGDNNSAQDACVVKEDSIIFRVLEVNKDVYVIDKSQYDQHVEEYQSLLFQYREDSAELDDLAIRLQGNLDNYNQLQQSGAQARVLEQVNELSLELWQRILELVDGRNEARKDMQDAQRRIEQTVIWQ